jgi:hypothetical protein
MRINADPTSPHYWANHFRSDPEIYFDGKQVDIDYVVEADDETGEIEQVKMNGAQPIYAGGRYISEFLTGKVEIRGERI